MSTSETPYPRLVGDIGGTRARFATVESPGAVLSHPSTHACADFAGFEQLLSHRLDTATGPRPRVAALGVATPVTGDRVRMTNLDWSFSIDDLRQTIGLERVVVLNDFATLALALPGLRAQELHRIGAGAGVPTPNGPLAVLGPGTGLGVAGLARRGSTWLPVTGEGGHATLAADDDREEAVLRALRTRFGHVSAERVLSGPGLVHLYDALAAIAGSAAESLQPEDVTQRALDDSDATCRQAVAMFLGWLGALAGDLALTFGARGGVYVGGGVVPRILPLLSGSDFRSRFERKGRFADYLAAIPTWLVMDAPNAALHGACVALDGPSDPGAVAEKRAATRT
ncbi:MAG: glucokinase [Caldimonas sp.]